MRNQRTLLRRNWKRGELPERLLSEFKQDIESAERAHDLAQLLGAEGNAAARYFRHFAQMLSVPAEGHHANGGTDAQRATDAGRGRRIGVDRHRGREQNESGVRPLLDERTDADQQQRQR